MISYSGVRARPSVFGMLAVAALPSIAVLRPSANDPDLAALTWLAACVAILIGLVWPVAAIRQVRVISVDPGGDSAVGAVAAIRLELGAAAGGLELSWADGESGWYRAGGAMHTVMGLRPTMRGVRDELRLTIRTAGPLGLVTASRSVAVSLDRPWYVGPRPSAPDTSTPLRTAETPPASAPLSTGAELVRSLRAYVPGDPAHLVHWPTTARVGQPMIRQMEAPAGVGAVVAVDLGPGPPGRTSERIEAAVRRADSLIRAALRDDVLVVLATNERGVAVTRICRDVKDLTRRLAAATTGPISVPGGPGLPIERVTP